MATAQQIVPAMHDAGENPDAPSAKFDFLLCCCRAALAGRDTEFIPAQGVTETEWDGVLGMAELHGVLPLLCPPLLRISNSLPRNVEERIRRSEILNARRALLLTGELLRVAQYFQEQNIPVLPYKGPALSQLLYADVTRRQAGDLDLLVPPCDVARATEALATLGFQPHLNLSQREQRWYLKSGYEYTFAGPAGENMLELKWRILPNFYAIPFDLDGMFRRSQPLRLGGTQTATLSAEDSLLVLCVHAAKHTWSRLGWLCDIAKLADALPLNWIEIEARARAMRIERIVALNFLLARQLLKTALPGPVRVYANSDPEVQQIAEEIAVSMRQGKLFDAESLAYFQLMAKSREHVKDRVTFWWCLGTTPSINEWSALKLPRPLGWLYRGVRLCRLGRRLASGKLTPAFLGHASQANSSHKLVRF